MQMKNKFTKLIFYLYNKRNMARALSRKQCLKKTAKALHRKAKTRRQHQKVVGKASKACSRKMRLKKGRKTSARKTRVRRQVRQPTPTPASFSVPTPTQTTRQPTPRQPTPSIPIGTPQPIPMLIQSPVNLSMMNSPEGSATGSLLSRTPEAAPIEEYSYGWFLNVFRQAAGLAPGGNPRECNTGSLTRALRSESRNLLVGVHNENREAYEDDDRRYNMLRAYDQVLDECDRKGYDMGPRQPQADQGL